MGLTIAGTVQIESVVDGNMVVTQITNMEPRARFNPNSIFLEIELKDGSTIELHGLGADLIDALTETYRKHTNPEGD